MPNGIRNQTVRVSNYLDLVNDTLPGGGANVVASINPGLAPGQVGARVTLNGPKVPIYATDNQYEGTFQYVQTLSSDTTAPAKGVVAYWSDHANKIVTTAATNADDVAGVYIGAPTKGNYCFIKALEGGRTLVYVGANTSTVGMQVIAGSGTSTTAAAGTAITPGFLGTILVSKDSNNNAVVSLKGQQS